MKRSDALQLAVILVGLVMGLLTLQYLISSLYAVFLWLFDDGNGMLSPMLTIFAVAGLQTLFCWILISRSAAIAGFIRRVSGFNAEIQIVSQPTDLLYILLVVLGIYLLFANTGPLLTAIIESFTKKSSPANFDPFSDQRPVKWIPLVVEIVLPVILLIFGKPIAAYFSKVISSIPIEVKGDVHASDADEKTVS